MAIKVPTPVTQGVSPIGDVALTTTPGTPFQSFKAPTNLALDAGLVGKIGAGASKSVKQIAGVLAQKNLDDENIALLELQKDGGEKSRAILDDALSQQQGNAIGSVNRANKAIQDFIKEAPDDSNLSTPAKIAQRRYLQGLRKQILNSVSSHEREQKRLHTIALIDTSIADAQSAGVIAYKDDDALEKSRGLIFQRAKSRAELTQKRGSEEAKMLAKKLANEATSKMYLQAIKRALANKDHTRAKDLLDFARQGEFLDAETGDLADAEKSVSVGVTLGRAQEIAQEIKSHATTANDEEAALKEARRRAGKDSELEKSLVTEVKTLFKEDETARKKDLREKKEIAVGLAREGKFNDIDSGTLAELGGNMTAALEAISARKRRGAPIISDPATYNKLNRMSSEALQKVDLLDPEIFSKLNDKDFRKFSDRQGTEFRQDDPAAQTAQRTRVQIVNHALDAASITNDVKIKGFNDALDTAIRTIEITNKPGIKATSEQIQKLTDLLLIDGEYEGGPRSVDPDVRVFQLKKGQKFMLDDLDDIPDHALLSLRETAAKHGEPNISDEDLLEKYNEHLRRRIAATGVGQ